MRRNRALMVAVVTLATAAIALDHQRARRTEATHASPTTQAPIDGGGYGGTLKDAVAPGYGGRPAAEAITEAGGYGFSSDDAGESYGAEAGGYGTVSGESEYSPEDED